MFIGFGWGVTNETWFPNVKSVGESYELSEGLVPLAKHQNDMTVIQGCVNRFSNELIGAAHSGSPEQIGILSRTEFLQLDLRRSSCR